MSAPTQPSSPIVQFFDNFLQEKNIKWLLAIGVAILLGSSVMLVNSHWNSLGEAWKYLILVGYVGAIHAAAQWSFHSMGLRKTGTVLMGLTVLLIPLTFICWHLFVMGNWLEPGLGATSRPVAFLLLLINIVFAGLAADRIFSHFLQGRQTTFSTCYIFLCVAGAITPTIAETGSTFVVIVVSLILWAAYVVGSVKVNRHVFWLVETHQSPRIYGFFPVILLGTQFLSLFAINFGGHIPTQWLGLGLAQFAVPIFMTADVVAKTFKQRTGELVHKLPWAVALPLSLGILFCVAGLVLAASPIYVGGVPYAIVPTAILVAIVMGAAANSTQHKALTWFMLVATLLTYNFSPIFFREFARQLVQSGAELVNASRLPYAFYGLTYLPLLAGLTAAAVAAQKRNWSVFATPIRQLSIGLPILLLITSFTEPSLGCYPAFPVSVAMGVVFVVKIIFYKNPILAIPAIISLLIAAISLPAFVSQVFNLHLTAFVGLMVAQVAGTLLTFLGPWWDQKLRELVNVRKTETELHLFRPDTICRSFGLLTMAGTAIAWLGMAWYLNAPAIQVYGSGFFISAILLRHAFINELDWLTGATYAFTLSILGMALLRNDISQQQSLNIAAGLFLTQWRLDYFFARASSSRLSRVFRATNFVTATIGLTVLVPFLAIQHAVILSDISIAITGYVANLLCALLSVWCFEVAHRKRHPTYGYMGYGLGALLATTIAVRHFDMPASWLPVIWSTLPLLVLPVLAISERRRKAMDECLAQSQDIVLGEDIILAEDIALADAYEANEAVRRPLTDCIFGTFLVLATITMVVPIWEARLAGTLSLIGLVFAGALTAKPWARVAAAAFATWHLMTGALQVVGLDRTLHFLAEQPGYACSIFAAIGSATLLVWDRYQQVDDKLSNDIAWTQSNLLQIISTVALTSCFVSVFIQSHRTMSAEIAMTLTALIAVATNQLMAAIKTDAPIHGWGLLGALAAGVVYLLLAFSLPVYGLVPAIVLLVASFLAEGLGRRLQHKAAFRTPVQTTSFGGAIAAAIMAAIQSPTPASSLVMLFAAGLFFWKGMNTRDTKGTHVPLFGVSAIITIATLWRTLFNFHYGDPQLYLIPTGIIVLAFVEVLRRDLPTSLANALRYGGALCILVSPTFEIIGGSWLHMFVLMVSSVLLIMLSMGVRAKALLYVGTGFLAADLVAMGVRGCLDQPSLLWLAGIGVGVVVLFVAAVAENGRERLLQRMRILSATLDTWN